MNKQEIFDTVATHLINQGCKSVTNEEDMFFCMYRGPNGTKCAIGVLIPDELYDDAFEGNSLYGIIYSNKSLPSYFAQHSAFLRQLQMVHDTASEESFINDVKSKLKEIAHTYSLNNEVLYNE